MNEKLLQIANMMHVELCGCDDKTCEMASEIYNWLYNGDAVNLTIDDVPDLLSEWREYEGQ